MAFESWLTVNPDPARLQAQADRTRLTQVAEAQERAALMLRLGWSKGHATRRVTENQRWEAEVTGRPVLDKKELTAIVAEVYRGQGEARKPG